MKFKIFAIAALAGFATACATPDPVEPPVETPVQRPVERPVEPPVDPGPTPGSVAHFQENAGDRVFFGYDRHDLSAQARQVLQAQASWLSTYRDARIRIEGNCDERGTREYNLALGARRANAARDYLISLGVDASRITTVSYGKERPSCNQSSESCWARNRNATSTLIGGYTN